MLTLTEAWVQPICFAATGSAAYQLDVLKTGLATGVVFGATVLGTPIALTALRRLGIVDVPNHRSSHRRPTVRGAGIAAAVGCLIGLVISPTSAISLPIRIAFATTIGFGILGLIEDVRGIGIARRLAAQLALAVGCAASMSAVLVSSPVVVVGTGLVTTVWIVAYVNVFNFMDGINGISAAQVVVAGLSSFIVGETRGLGVVMILGLLSTAAALAFMPWNFPRAKVFLGDSGSYFFGGWLSAAAALEIYLGGPIEAAVFPQLIYVADTTCTLVRRVLRGEAWYSPHREHIYQQLILRGNSHARVTLWVGSCAAACAALGVASIGSSTVGRGMADLAAAAVVGLYLLSPTLCARRTVVTSPPAKPPK